MTNGVHKSAIPCDCGCECVIVWEWEEWGDEPHQVWVDFSVAYPADRLRARLKAAWRVIRRKDPWLHSIVLQDEGLEQFRRAIRCEVQS